MKYAFVNDNSIKKIEDLDETEALSQGQHFQQIIPIEGMTPEPEVGWKWENGILFKYFQPINPRQIRQALLYMGVSLTMIDDALNSLPEPTKSFARVSWEYAPTFERNDVLVASVASLLGWTNEQVDYLWEFGATL